MLINLDVVDILQLHEIWSRRPVVTAFTRLETRQTELPCAVDFNVDQLLPRLARLKHSSVWRVSKANLTNDPARIPMRDLSDEYLSELYPEADSAAVMRQQLFSSAYNRFVIAHYSAEVEQTRQLLHHLAQVRHVAPEQCLDPDSLPQPGSPEWIPADITDEIRSLDERYHQSQPGLPATFIIADRFWSLFAKASPDELEQSSRLACPDGNVSVLEAYRQAIEILAQVAFAWNRSPSVVGLCYQVFS